MQQIIRIELHSDNPQDFDILHDRLEGKGILRIIQDYNGKWYLLPRATYFSTNNFNNSELLEICEEEIKRLNKTAEILVIEFTESNWKGLKQID